MSRNTEVLSSPRSECELGSGVTRPSLSFRRSTRWWVVGVIAVLSAALCAFDISQPRGVAIGALYSPLILASIWGRRIRIALGFALLFSVLIVLGWWQSSSADMAWTALINRGICVALVWLCGAMVVSRMMATDHLLTVVEAAPAGMIVANRKRRVVFANAEAGRVLGAHFSELRHLHLNRIFSSHVWLRGMGVEAKAALHAAGAQPTRREVQCRRLDGTWFAAELSMRTMKTEAGRMFCVSIRDLTQDRLREEGNERLASIVRSSRDAILAKDVDGRVTDWNPGAQAMFGYRADEVLGKFVTLLFPDDLRGEFEEIASQVRAGRVVTKHTRRVTKDGRTLDVHVSVSPLYDYGGRVIGASTITRDETGEREAERRVLELNTALSHAMPGMATVSPQGILETTNQPFAKLTKEGSDPLGRPWLELVGPEDRDAARSAVEGMLREGRSELTVRSGCTQERHLELFLVRRLDSGGRYLGFHLFLRDVTERALHEAKVAKLATRLADANQRLERQAHIDPLTGLLNRRGLQQHLAKLRAGGRRRGASGASVILVDIDDFKHFNSRHGHAGGDRVLVAVAKSLARQARVSDFVARIGGDEFLLVLPGTLLGEAALVAERMRDAIEREAVKIGDSETVATCSFGVTSLPGGELTIDQLIEAVGQELAHSKVGGKNLVSSGGATPETSSLRDIIAGKGLRAFQQPIFDLLEDRVAACELLSRGPRGRYESPAVFLNLLHAGEALTQLDLACLRECVRAGSHLPDHVCLHVNLFSSTVVGLGAKQIIDELESLGAGHRFCIELNERDVLGDSAELMENVRALREAGIQIAVDDVGFGRSCLEALITLEPDVIKIDRAYVSAENTQHLERLMRVANVLNARVIAEGVEDEETLARLRSLRVRYAQGFHLGRPEPVKELRLETLSPRPRRAPKGSSKPRATRSKKATG